MFRPNSYVSKSLLLFFLILFSSIFGFSQNRKKLEEQKRETLQKIKETEKIIKETKSQKRATIGQLSAINKQIEEREKLIETISEELRLLDEEILEKEGLVEALEADIKSLKEEYAAMIYAASKMDNSYYRLAFIFSAGSINQMIMRMKYFEQYSNTRQHQLELIEKVKNDIDATRLQLSRKRIEQSNLLSHQTEESNTLTVLKTEKNKVVSELSKKEKELKSELEANKKSVKQLEKKILEVIETERKKAIAAAEKAAREKSKAAAAEVKETKELTSSFGGNRNRLPWPAKGSIVKKYGRQRHPVLGVEEINLGIGIQTVKGEKAKSVFAGKVVAITNDIPGMNTIVMIQHGEYFTVYLRLKNVVVKKDQTVDANEVLGEVYTSKDNSSMMEFQIWKGNDHQNPEEWLR